jgi:hypothetical protein
MARYSYFSVPLTIVVLGGQRDVISVSTSKLVVPVNDHFSCDLYLQSSERRDCRAEAKTREKRGVNIFNETDKMIGHRDKSASSLRLASNDSGGIRGRSRIFSQR